MRSEKCPDDESQARRRSARATILGSRRRLAPAWAVGSRPIGLSMVARMETLEVARPRPRRHHHPESAREEERRERDDVDRAARHVPRNQERDDDRVVVITGAGGNFCSGADLSGGGAEAQRRHQLAVMRHIGDAALALHRMPKPTIAKVNGVAVGAGCNLALGCDLIVSSDEARFSEIFARRAVTDRLRRLVAAPAAHRHASSEGARAARRHHLGEGGRSDRTRQSGRARRRTRPRSSTIGRRGSQRARRSRSRRRSVCSTTRSR